MKTPDLRVYNDPDHPPTFKVGDCVRARAIPSNDGAFAGVGRVIHTWWRRRTGAATSSRGSRFWSSWRSGLTTEVTGRCEQQSGDDTLEELLDVNVRESIAPRRRRSTRRSGGRTGSSPSPTSSPL